MFKLWLLECVKNYLNTKIEVEALLKMMGVSMKRVQNKNM